MKTIWLAAFLAGTSLLGTITYAHEVRPAYLELRQTAPEVYAALWKVPARADRRLAVYVELPAAVTPATETHAAFTEDAYVERWTFRAPGGLAGRRIRIAGLEATRIDVLARIVHTSGATQTVRVLPSEPTFVVDAVPSAWQVSSTYLSLGVEHILWGIDHLLFVLALMLLVQGWKRLLVTVTTFTVAHSLTLALATLGVVSVASEPVEASIALSIVFVAAEVIHGHQGRPGLTGRAPWTVAFTFGLLHGLGFAGALREVGVPEQAVPVALLFFNLGVELGQVVFIGAVAGLFAIAGRLRLPSPPWQRRLLAYAVGSVAMFWVIERTSRFFS